jgi:hypothetical protein
MAQDLWELQAREAIRDTIAAYHEAGDRYRLDELAACFTEDGVLEVRGQEPAVGRTAIVAMLSRPLVDPERSTDPAVGRFYVRHHVSSLRFASVSATEALVTAYFLVVTPIGPDHWGRYRDRLVPVGDRWLFRHRLVATDGHAAGSFFTGAG